VRWRWGVSDSAVKRDSDSAGSEGVLMLQEEERIGLFGSAVRGVKGFDPAVE
jgi:hypothetical protein